MQLVRCAFDPDGIANPGKISSTPPCPVEPHEARAPPKVGCRS